MPQSLLSKIYFRLKQYFQAYIQRDPRSLEALRWLSDEPRYQLRHRYPLGENAVIFDCGGFQGDWAAEMAELYPTAKIFIFEVVEEYARNLNQRFKEFDRIKVHNFGLGSEEKSIEIVMSGFGSGAFTQGNHLSTVNGQVKDIATFIREHQFKKIDLLKLNIEGGEYELLTRLLDSELIDICQDIQVQFHNYGEWCVSKREEIRGRLMKTHRLTYDYSWIFENWRRIAHG